MNYVGQDAKLLKSLVDEIKELKKENNRLWLIKTQYLLDAEEVEDNAFDYAISNEIFYGYQTRRMLHRFIQDNYGLKEVKK